MLRPASVWSTGVLAFIAIVAWALEVVRYPGSLRFQENLLVWTGLLLGLAAASLVSVVVGLALERLVRHWLWWQETLAWVLLAVLAGPALFSVTKIGGGIMALAGLLVAHLWTVTALNAWTVTMLQLEPLRRWKWASWGLWLAGSVGIMAIMIRQIA